MFMLISEFDFELPTELIAQVPLQQRESSRMLAVDRHHRTFADSLFADLPLYLKKGDVLVLNNTRVFPARIFGKTKTGAKIETFLVRETSADRWEVLAKPGRRLKVGTEIDFGDRLRAVVIEKLDDGKIIVEFIYDGDLFEILEKIGVTPLPPYIKREKGGIDGDRERYQTVFAKTPGAIAAPTAGLHFTPEIIDQIKAGGVELAELTLHVGYGTFEPVRVDDVSKHTVSAEAFEIGVEAADSLNRARTDGRRIVAIGTTTTRALETTIAKFDDFVAGQHSADITITPGYRFQAIDAVLTNFHLPQSSLLVLTSTFGGYHLIMKAYRHAVEAKYRFYSYGDCMFIS